MIIEMIHSILVVVIAIVEDEVTRDQGVLFPFTFNSIFYDLREYQTQIIL